MKLCSHWKEAGCYSGAFQMNVLSVMYWVLLSPQTVFTRFASLVKSEDSAPLVLIMSFVRSSSVILNLLFKMLFKKVIDKDTIASCKLKCHIIQLDAIKRRLILLT